MTIQVIAIATSLIMIIFPFTSWAKWLGAKNQVVGPTGVYVLLMTYSFGGGLGLLGLVFLLYLSGTR